MSKTSIQAYKHSNPDWWLENLRGNH